MEKQNKELKTYLAELETAEQRKSKANIAAPKKENNVEVQRHGSCRKVRAAAAAAVDDSDRAALRR